MACAPYRALRLEAEVLTHTHIETIEDDLGWRPMYATRKRVRWTCIMSLLAHVGASLAPDAQYVFRGLLKDSLLFYENMVKSLRIGDGKDRTLRGSE